MRGESEMLKHWPWHVGEKPTHGLDYHASPHVSKPMQLIAKLTELVDIVWNSWTEKFMYVLHEWIIWNTPVFSEEEKY